MQGSRKIILVIVAIGAAGLICFGIVVWSLVVANREISSVTAADWGASYNTQGASLTLSERGRHPVSGSTHVDYMLTAVGLPDSFLYRLWFKPVDGAPYLAGGLNGPDLKITSAGQVVTAADPATPIPLWVERFARGQPFELALIAPGGGAKAFARVIPFPIETRGSGACYASVELTSLSGTGFLIHGEGFEPGEEVNAQADSGTQPAITRRAGSSGAVDIEVSPALSGQQSGQARYTLVGRSCRLTPGFAWGAPALELQ